jgi:FdhD protein
MIDAARTFGVVHVDVDTGPNAREEHVAHEEPLEIQVNGASVAVLMRTPGHDQELGTGFLLTERMVRGVDEIESVRHCTMVPDPEAEENVLQVRLKPGVPFDLERFRRNTFASSSCGVCGKATLENACAVAAPLSDDAHIAAENLAELPEKLRAAQLGFGLTGGLHGAGLFTLAGALVAVREDVGRHNTVDKLVGFLAANSLEPGRYVLLVSGRVSFELVQKAAAARIPIVAGISAPSSLAVRMARELRVTLVGFLRGRTMNLYAGDERVLAGPPGSRPNVPF